MHHLLMCSLYVSTASFSLLGFEGRQHLVVVVLLLGVAILGIPHGGLDHWTGRRLLATRLGGAWWSVFFVGYLVVALAVVVGWLLVPVLTAISFFVLSAWHFGLDDERLGGERGTYAHLSAIAFGGIVIWVPALWRAEEMQNILLSIVPTQLAISASGIVATTQVLGIPCLLIVSVSLLSNLFKATTRTTVLRQLLLCVTCAVAPILVSFGLYFCFWHSVRGLQSLYRQSGLSPVGFASATLPLSLGAVGLVVVGTLGWSEGKSFSSEATRSLFIGLSAMAVPHLLVQGIASQSESLAPVNFTATRPSLVQS